MLQKSRPRPLGVHAFAMLFACIVYVICQSLQRQYLTFSMATIAFNRSQCFVLCDQSEEFMQRQRALKKLIRVTSVQLHDKLSGTEKDEWGCAYGKVFGTTLRMARCFGPQERQGDLPSVRLSHLCAPCSYDARANSS